MRGRGILRTSPHGVLEALRHFPRRETREPDVAIYATTNKLVVPSVGEGFDDLLCVRLNGSTFEIRGC